MFAIFVKNGIAIGNRYCAIINGIIPQATIVDNTTSVETNIGSINVKVIKITA